MENGKTFIIAFASIILALVVGWVAWTYKTRDNDLLAKTVVLNGEAQKELSVSLTDMYPGHEEVCEVNFQGEQGREYSLVFSFKASGEVSLAPYVNVQIKYGGEVKTTKKLSEFLEGRMASLEIAFTSGTKTAVEIVYVMPLEVGDEAQGAVANFTMTIQETPSDLWV